MTYGEVLNKWNIEIPKMIHKAAALNLKEALDTEMSADEIRELEYFLEQGYEPFDYSEGEYNFEQRYDGDIPLEF